MIRRLIGAVSLALALTWSAAAGPGLAVEPTSSTPPVHATAAAATMADQVVKASMITPLPAAPCASCNNPPPGCGASCHPPPPGSGGLIGRLLSFIFGFFHR